MRDNCNFDIEPKVALDKNYGLSPKELNLLQKVIEERKDEIKKAWEKHFGS